MCDARIILDTNRGVFRVIPGRGAGLLTQLERLEQLHWHTTLCCEQNPSVVQRGVAAPQVRRRVQDLQHDRLSLQLQTVSVQNQV